MWTLELLRAACARLLELLWRPFLRIATRRVESANNADADCRCYFTENFYVQSPIRGHFSFSGAARFEQEQSALLESLTTAQRAELLGALEAEAERRRSQGRLAAARKARIAARYAPRHPELWTLRPDWQLHPDFVSLVEAARRHGPSWVPPSAVLRELCPGVFALPVFTTRFCEALCEELEAVRRSGLETGRPNSMNAHGVLLDELGLGPGLLDPLLRDWIGPLAAAIPALGGGGGAHMDRHKSFVVRYEMGQDEELSSHYDNAELTLNVSLGRGFESGELLFYGPKGRAAASPLAAHDWTGAGAGHAVLHLGRELHAALPITAGERLNLVMWCRSTRWRRREGCPMCGRTDQLLRPDERVSAEDF